MFKLIDKKDYSKFDLYPFFRMALERENIGDSSSIPGCSTENGYDDATCQDCPSNSNNNPPSEGTYLKRSKQTYFDDEKVLIPEDENVSRNV